MEQQVDPWLIFFPCLVVFLILALLLTALIVILVRLTVRLIRGGLADRSIQQEHFASESRPITKAVGKVLSFLSGIALFVALGLSLFLNIGGRAYPTRLPVPRVVKTDSMARRAPENIYLWEHQLTDQLQPFDLILTHPLPDEFELKLYDVVVYERDGIEVIHRIVDILEPDAQEPIRKFIFRGDSVSQSDRYPVSYGQMKGIYRGERLPYLGSFAMFMQSPAGWLCIFLVVFAEFAASIVERRLSKEKQRRLRQLGALSNEWDGFVSDDQRPGP